MFAIFSIKSNVDLDDQTGQVGSFCSFRMVRAQMIFVEFAVFIHQL